MQVYNDPDQAPEKPPIFRKGFPNVVLFLAGAIIVVSLIQFNVPLRTQDWMFSIAAIAGGPSFENVVRPWGDFAPYVLHVFLHGGAFHLMLNMAMLDDFCRPAFSLQTLQMSFISVTSIQLYFAPVQRQLFAAQMRFIAFGSLEEVIFLFSVFDTVLNAENLTQYANAK